MRTVSSGLHNMGFSSRKALEAEEAQLWVANAERMRLEAKNTKLASQNISLAPTKDHLMAVFSPFGPGAYTLEVTSTELLVTSLIYVND